jgi:hypothetical protein
LPPLGCASRARTASCLVPLCVASEPTLARLADPLGPVGLFAPLARTDFTLPAILRCDILGSSRLRRHQVPSPPKPHSGNRASGARSRQGNRPACVTNTRSVRSRSPVLCAREKCLNRSKFGPDLCASPNFRVRILSPQPASSASLRRFRLFWTNRRRCRHLVYRLCGRKVAPYRPQTANLSGQSPFANYQYPFFLPETRLASAETGSIFRNRQHAVLIRAPREGSIIRARDRRPKGRDPLPD